jgi:triosephosphate isomerase
MKRVIVGNWKMNLNIRQSEVLLGRLKANIINPTASVVVCPTFVSLSSLSNIVKSYGDSTYAVGAQNIFDKDDGPFTGEVSAEIIKGLVDYCIVGHSERRIVFGERDDLIANKLAACIRNHITPILCVGENIHQREEGLAKRTIMDQLEEDLSEIVPEEVKSILIAYEPVWAIGTGKNASVLDVKEILTEIQKYLINKYGDAIAPKVRILYGGSVNADNAKSYLDISICDGLLVGGASLNYKEFSKICQL